MRSLRRLTRRLQSRRTAHPDAGLLLADYGIYRADVSASLPVAADIELQKKTYPRASQTR